MAFEARRLRVQLPCSDTTVVDGPVEGVVELFLESTTPVCTKTPDCCPNWPRTSVFGGIPGNGIFLLNEGALFVLRKQLEQALEAVDAAQSALRDAQNAD
jgi:hypothetical protein